MRFFTLLSFVCAGLCLSPAFAQETKETSKKTETPITKWIEAENKLIDTLSKD